jgi:hypothetical protein
VRELDISYMRTVALAVLGTSDNASQPIAEASAKSAVRVRVSVSGTSGRTVYLALKINSLADSGQTPPAPVAIGDCFVMTVPQSDTFYLSPGQRLHAVANGTGTLASVAVVGVDLVEAVD